MNWFVVTISSGGGLSSTECCVSDATIPFAECCGHTWAVLTFVLVLWLLVCLRVDLVHGCNLCIVFLQALPSERPRAHKIAEAYIKAAGRGQVNE